MVLGKNMLKTIVILDGTKKSIYLMYLLFAIIFIWNFPIIKSSINKAKWLKNTLKAKKNKIKIISLTKRNFVIKEDVFLFKNAISLIGQLTNKINIKIFWM